MSETNILLVNWGTGSVYYALKKSIDLKKDKIFLATTPFLPQEIKNLFAPENLIYTNPYDSQKLIEDVVDFINNRKINFEIVTTFFEMNVYQASVLADFLKCPRFLSPESALKTSVNKLLTRLALKEKQIIQPRFELFDENDLSKAFAFYQKIKKPVVIKPVHSGHGYGTRFVEKNLSFRDFKNLYQKARNDLTRSYDEWMTWEKPFLNSRFLIEEFIGGTMVSCDGFVRGKDHLEFIGTTEFGLSKPPFLNQISHFTPPVNLNKKQVQQCQDYTRQIISVLGLQYCGFHCEMKYEKNQPYLVEISGRLPGGTVLQAYQETSSDNIFDKFFAVFGEKKKEEVKNPVFFKSEATRFFFSHQKFGQLKNIKIPEAFKNKNVEISSNHLKEKEIFGSLKETRGAWLLTLTLRSKKLNSVQLQKKIEILAGKIKMEIDSGLLVLLKVIFRKFIRKLSFRKNSVKI